MINVSEDYKQASESNTRVSYVIAKYGLYNKKAKTYIENTSGSYKSFSNLSKTYNEIKDTNYNYISCEPDRVKLDGTFYFVSNKNTPNSSELIAYWSNELSNANGTFENNPKIIYTFSEEVEFTELTLHFQEVCSGFVVRYYNGNTLVATREINGNTSLIVTTNGETTYSTNSFNRLEIEFVKTQEPYRYIKFNEIDFGTYQQLTDEQIVDYNIINELSIDSSDLSASSLTLSIDDEKGEYDILNPNNKLNLLQEQQEITLYHYLQVNGIMQELPLGTFLLKNFNVRYKTLEIEAYDDTYFMNRMYYGGYFYQNEEVTKILEDLFFYFNYTNYEIDSELSGIKLTGFVPNVEFREALRLICEASGCVINKNRYGKTYIFKTYNNVAKTFNQRIIFNESPSRNLFNNVIDVVEYYYNEKQENVEIYNATLDVGEYIIIYNQFPVDEKSVIKSETNSDYTIIKVYATSCVVNVTRKTNVILKGIHYKPNSIVKRIQKGTTSNTSNYAINKVNNYLITTNNSQSIGNWKLERKDIKYKFDTLVMPYIEVGDTCIYKTRYGTSNEFIPTRIEFSKSIKQNIEGE